MLDGLDYQKNSKVSKKSKHPWGPLPSPQMKKESILDRSKVNRNPKYDNNPKIKTWEDRNRANNGTKLNTNWSS